jgi:hypothetical protein
MTGLEVATLVSEALAARGAVGVRVMPTSGCAHVAWGPATAREALTFRDENYAPRELVNG